MQFTIENFFKKYNLKTDCNVVNLLSDNVIDEETLKFNLIDIRNRAYKEEITFISEEFITTRVDHIGLAEIDVMKGRDFEIFIGNLLCNNGFTNIRITPLSGDFGADVIAEKDYIKYAIQCKRYSNPVGITAVQEVIASKSLHDCHVACVLTNSTFTP